MPNLYCNINSFQQVPTVYLQDMTTFEQLIDKYKPDLVMVSEEEQENGKKIFERARTVFQPTTEKPQTNTFLSFFVHGLLYSVSAMGYYTIEDYKQGTTNGYQWGGDYYRAAPIGFVNYNEYEACQRAGFALDRKGYLQAAEQGFDKAYAKIEHLAHTQQITENTYRKLKNLSTDAQIYIYAQKLGYHTFEQLEKAIRVDFVDVLATTFETAQQKGFNTYHQFAKAQQGDFETPDQMNDALAIGISTRDKYEKYQTLNALKIKYTFKTTEQALIYDLLQQMPSKKVLPTTRIWEMLKEAERQFMTNTLFGNDDDQKKWYEPLAQIVQKSKLPNWYSADFRDISDLKTFLNNNPYIKVLGDYDTEADVFERNAPSELPNSL